LSDDILVLPLPGLARYLRSSMADEHPLIEFRTSPIHGTGGFARAFIARGARIIEYVGDRISKRESLRRCEENNEYIFSLDARWDLDGKVPWNQARLVNHSCVPNCDALNLEGRIWIAARRDIEVGEEITFNYGYDLVDYQDHRCRCGSPDCVGYIVAEEFFPTLRARAGAGAPPELA
jgi:uncharacterized protein